MAAIRAAEPLLGLCQQCQWRHAVAGARASSVAETRANAEPNSVSANAEPYASAMANSSGSAVPNGSAVQLALPMLLALRSQHCSAFLRGM